MSALFSSQASSYPHRPIQLLTFEIHVRYYRFYLTNPDHLGAALAAFLDERGSLSSDAGGESEGVLSIVAVREADHQIRAG